MSIWTLDQIILPELIILLCYIESFLNNSRSTITNCYLTFFLRVKILNKNTWRERLDYMRVKIPRLNSIFIITE